MNMYKNNKQNVVVKAEQLTGQDNSNLLTDYNVLRTQGIESLYKRLSEKQENWKNIHYEQKYKLLAELQAIMHVFNKNKISNIPLRHRLSALTKQDFDLLNNCNNIYRKHLGLECDILNSNENDVIGRIMFTKFEPKKTCIIKINRQSKQYIFIDSSDDEENGQTTEKHQQAFL